MGKARITYYFNDDNMISGMLYASVPTAKPPPKGRAEEFKSWAAKRYPGLLDSDEMDIPKQPKRWRSLLAEWRREAVPTTD